MISPGAVLGEGCRIGPFSVVEEYVELGAGCLVGPHVYLTGHTAIGARNRFHAGAVIGDAPQDIKYGGLPTRLHIGDENHFREHVTIHRSNKMDEETRIGDRNLFMAGSHVGHNCQIGSENILANGALLAGHVTLADRVFISGNCLIHQFCRVGRLALMQGGSAISKDLPPFCLARGDNGMAGLNTIGLRRAGFSAEERMQLRRLFHVLFRSGTRLSHALIAARDTFPDPVAQEVIAFVAGSRRGICAATGHRGSAEASAAEVE